MSEQEVQESQKTVVAFIAGLLVGGLLVWIFADTPAQAPTTVETNSTETTESDTNSDTAEEIDAVTESSAETEPTRTLPTGDAAATLESPAAGSVVNLDGATFPTDAGWIAVRTYTGGTFGPILGAAEYNKAQGLVPESIELLSPTIAGRDYAIVFFSEDGNSEFNLDGDVQLDTDIISFTAQ